ncbi:MAG: glycosyl hydrolase family 28-related protein [Pirellulales bacterium]
MIVLRALFWGLLFVLAGVTAAPAQTAGYVVPTCTGDPRKDTPILQSAFARGGLILLPACKYVVSGTFRLLSGTQLIGAGYAHTTIHTLLGNGAPLIDSDPAASLSDVHVSGISFDSRFGNGLTGQGDAFLLHGVTDTTFERIRVRNFRGNGFTIRKPTGQATSLLRARFSSVFVISVGGYAFDVDGSVDATWNMIDVNSATTGAFRFRSGSTTNPPIQISGFIAEWHKTYASKNHIVLFDNPNGQVVNFMNCSAMTFGGFGDLSFIRSLGTVKVNFTGCTGGNGTTVFKNWITSPSKNVAFAWRINSSY